MKILHINAYYIDNHLYSKLYSKLDKELCQLVYIPIKTNRNSNNERQFNNTRLYFDKLIKPYHKLFYRQKVNLLSNRVKTILKDFNPDIVHAHNLFIDGAVAYNLKKKYGIKYITAVRNTDVLLQYKYMFHRRNIANKVLNEAEKIIFISPTFRDKLFEMIPDRIVEKISNKIEIIPNGIDDFWFENKNYKNKFKTEIKGNILFVGQIKAQKNLNRLIEAIESLNYEKRNLKLTIVGGENSLELKYFERFKNIIRNKEWINYLGKINDMNRLIEIFHNSDIFAMPSINELFGLVYVEALSQDLPIVYSKGEGISEYFKELPVGSGVDPKLTDSISTGIIDILDNYHNFGNLHQFAKPFNWERIAQIYREMYLNHE